MKNFILKIFNCIKYIPKDLLRVATLFLLSLIISVLVLLTFVSAFIDCVLFGIKLIQKGVLWAITSLTEKAQALLNASLAPY